MRQIDDAGYSQGAGSSERPVAVFGYEDFWPKVYKDFKGQFDAVIELLQLGNKMVEAAENIAAEPVKRIICALSRVTITGACESLLLCGNGFGTGAMKIVRGMYESRWTAEYLRQHPKEVKNYLDFSKVLLWRRLEWAQDYKADSVQRSDMEKAEADYQMVKGRFTDGKGKVRQQWFKKSIRAMAKKIGREKEYNLPYSIACSIHHCNFEGLAAQWKSDEGEATPDVAPSEAWVNRALIAVRTNLWFVLNTLNDAYGLDFQEKLAAYAP